MENNAMNWRKIFTLSLPGPVMGTLSLFGLTRGIEPVLWLLVALGCAWWLAKTVPSRVFLHGLFVGLLMGIGNSVMQSLFFDSYMASNPESAQAFQQIPGGLSPRIFVLMAGSIVGFLYGLLLGLFALLAAKFGKPRSAENPAT